MLFLERSKDYLQMIHVPAMVVYQSVFPKRDLWTVNLSAASEIFICSRVGQLLTLENVIPPLMGNPSNGHINPYNWVDDYPLPQGTSESLDPPLREEYSIPNRSV